MLAAAAGRFELMRARIKGEIAPADGDGLPLGGLREARLL